MLSAYVVEGPRLARVNVTAGEKVPPNPVWLDLLSPTAEEDSAVERALGIAVPTREEMLEIEPSSRLYHESDADYMTATVLARTDSEHPEAAAITFILTAQRLVTVRYVEPKSFDLCIARVQRTGGGVPNGPAMLVNLLDAIIDRAADILERLAGEIDRISHDVFAIDRKQARSNHFRGILNDLGRRGDLNSKVAESLTSLGRLLAFLTATLGSDPAQHELRARVKMLSRDVGSLTDYATFQSSKITFMLDATLGLISIEQSTIIKIFSVVAAVFLPPTLIASSYGMNFRVMPELHWALGYPFALLLMVASAVLTYWVFKRRGWL